MYHVNSCVKNIVMMCTCDKHVTNEKPIFVCREEGRMLSLTKLAPSGKCNVVTDIPKIAKIEVPKSQTHHHKEDFFA